MPKSSDILKSSSNPIVVLWNEFIVYVIPGAIALAPYFTYLFVGYDAISNDVFIKCNTTFLVVFYVLSSLVCGLILEELGSTIEIIWDGILDWKNDDHITVWYDYLALQYDNNPPVAYGYIKTLVVRLKFKLCLIPALFVFLIGVYFFNHDWYHKYIDHYYVYIIPLILLLFILYWTYDLSKTLSEIRKELVNRIKPD